MALNHAASISLSTGSLRMQYREPGSIALVPAM